MEKKDMHTSSYCRIEWPIKNICRGCYRRKLASSAQPARKHARRRHRTHPRLLIPSHTSSKPLNKVNTIKNISMSTILIVGATRGLGSSLVQAYAADANNHVLATARTSNPPENSKQSCKHQMSHMFMTLIQTI